MNSVAPDLTLFQALCDNIAEDQNKLREHYKAEHKLSTQEKTQALAHIIFSLCTHIRSTLVEWATVQEDFSSNVFKKIAKDSIDLCILYKYIHLFKSAIFNPKLVTQFQEPHLKKADAAIEAYIKQQQLISMSFSRTIILAKAAPEFENLRQLIAEAYATQKEQIRSKL